VEGQWGQETKPRRTIDRSIELLRLAPPPTPRAKDEHVGAEPRAGFVHSVELEDGTPGGVIGEVD